MFQVSKTSVDWRRVNTEVAAHGFTQEANRNFGGFSEEMRLLVRDLRKGSDWESLDKLLSALCLMERQTARKNDTTNGFHSDYVGVLLKQFRFTDARNLVNDWAQSVPKSEVEPPKTWWLEDISKQESLKRELDRFGQGLCPHCKADVSRLLKTGKCPACGDKVIVKKTLGTNIWLTAEQDTVRTAQKKKKN